MVQPTGCQNGNHFCHTNSQYHFFDKYDNYRQLFQFQLEFYMYIISYALYPSYIESYAYKTRMVRADCVQQLVQKYLAE